MPEELINKGAAQTLVVCVKQSVELNITPK